MGVFGFEILKSCSVLPKSGGRDISKIIQMMYVTPTDKDIIFLVESDPSDFFVSAYMFIVCIVHIRVLGEINLLACHLRSLEVQN